MNITFENKIFHGEIDTSITEEKFIPIDKDLYKNPARLSGKLNELRQQIEKMREELFHKLNMLDKDIVEWNSVYPRIISMLETLESSVSDRLFLRSDTDGFYKTFYDNFSTLERVNTITSNNVTINTDTNSVYLSSKTGQMAPREISSSEFSLSMSRPPGSSLERVVTAEGSNLNNLFVKNSIGWTGSISTNGANPVGLVLNVDFANPTMVAEINLSMLDATNTAVVSAIAIDENNNGNVVLDNVNISNSNVIPINRKVKKVQIIITKTNYDERVASGEYRYIFHLKRFVVTGEQSNVKLNKEGSFSSIDYFVSNASKIAIEVCDYIPDETNIDYYLNIQRADVNQQSFNPYAINPINKPPGSSPYALNMGIFKTNNNLNKLPFFTGTSNTISTDIVSSSSLGLNTLGINTKAINFLLATEMLNFNTIKVFSNYSELTLNPFESIEKIGNYYYTWVFINKPDTLLDVGNSGVEIEGLVKKDMIISLDKIGWFRVKIPVSSYIDVGSNFISIEDLKKRDPLFPYNGKYLIEGTNLNIEPYSGFTKRAKRRMEKVDNLSLLDKNSYYLMRVILDEGQRFIVVLDSSNDARNGYIEYQEQDIFTYKVSLIANLKTNLETRTPILSSYKIKVGD